MASGETLLSREWLRKADHDIGMAELALDKKPEYTDSICFHCQQAAEKYLKALLVSLKIEFKKSHSLTYLLDLLSDTLEITDEMYTIAGELEAYAVEVRYPDDLFEPSLKETKQALDNAIRIKAFVDDALSS